MKKSRFTAIAALVSLAVLGLIVAGCDSALSTLVKSDPVYRFDGQYSSDPFTFQSNEYSYEQNLTGEKIWLNNYEFANPDFWIENPDATPLDPIYRLELDKDNGLYKAYYTIQDNEDTENWIYVNLEPVDAEEGLYKATYTIPGYEDKNNWTYVYSADKGVHKQGEKVDVNLIQENEARVKFDLEVQLDPIPGYYKDSNGAIPETDDKVLLDKDNNTYVNRDKGADDEFFGIIVGGNTIYKDDIDDINYFQDESGYHQVYNNIESEENLIGYFKDDGTQVQVTEDNYIDGNWYEITYQPDVYVYNDTNGNTIPINLAADENADLIINGNDGIKYIDKEAPTVNADPLILNMSSLKNTKFSKEILKNDKITPTGLVVTGNSSGNSVTITLPQKTALIKEISAFSNVNPSTPLDLSKQIGTQGIGTITINVVFYAAVDVTIIPGGEPIPGEKLTPHYSSVIDPVVLEPVYKVPVDWVPEKPQSDFYAIEKQYAWVEPQEMTTDANRDYLDGSEDRLVQKSTPTYEPNVLTAGPEGTVIGTANCKLYASNNKAYLRITIDTPDYSPLVYVRCGIDLNNAELKVIMTGNSTSFEYEPGSTVYIKVSYFFSNN